MAACAGQGCYSYLLLLMQKYKIIKYSRSGWNYGGAECTVF